MLRWSLKSLWLDPLRSFAGTAGVAGTFVLVIFFGAVFAGESLRIVAYPTHTDADVWVMQEGVSNMHMASSLLWDWKQTRIAALPGVAAVASILYMNTVVDAGGEEWFSYIVGVESDARAGGPWAMVAGRRLPGPGQVVIPDVVARRADIGIGDRVAIADRQFSVVGLSRDTFSMANSVTFVTKQDLAELMRVGDAVSYILVKANPGVSADDLAQRIETEVPKVTALGRDTFIARDREMAMQMGTEIIRVMSLVGMALALLVVAFTAQAQIAHSRRELAVIKALGFPVTRIYASALYQTIAITVGGLLLAILLSVTVFPLVTLAAPQIALLLGLDAFVTVAVFALAVALLAGLGSARSIASVDPLQVFQE